MIHALIFCLALAQQVPAEASDNYAKVWDSCSQAIQSRYWARVSRKAEMDRLLAKYGPLAKAAKSRDEFEHIVNSMIAEFNDSHFEFLNSDAQGYYLMNALSGGKEEMPAIDAWFKSTADGYTVQMVMNGGEAEQAGLRKGDIVTAIGGGPFSPVAALRRLVDKQTDIQWTRGGKPMSGKVTVHQETSIDMFLDATKKSVRIIPSNGKKIGYVHLWTMANDRFRQALESIVFGKLNKTDAIILDIRDGFGGRPEGYGDPFFRPEVNIDWRFSEKGEPMHEMFGYQRPLVLLTNRGSRSAKEVFSAIIKKSGRGVVMGDTTAGNVLGTTPFRVCPWAYLELPSVDVVVDGKRLERTGVEPDIRVPKEFDDSGKDLYVASALSYLQEHPSRKP